MKAVDPKELTVKVKKLNKIKPDVFLLSFDSGYISAYSRPGQFLHVKIAETILRRPFSIHYVKGKSIFILFRVRGRGTKILSGYQTGDKLNLIGPLGKGFSLNGETGRNILVAGGLGVAPLFFLAQRLKKITSPKRKAKGLILLGAKNKQEILCEQEFKNMGYRVIIATEDGSKGYKGTVTGLLKKPSTIDQRLATNIYACGPEAMFKGLKRLIGNNKNIECQVSFEQFMGCGLGVCCGCTIETKNGYKKVCQDGPVFNIRDIW